MDLYNYIIVYIHPYKFFITFIDNAYSDNNGDGIYFTGENGAEVTYTSVFDAEDNPTFQVKTIMLSIVRTINTRYIFNYCIEKNVK
ncbi:hypothetical protein [Pontibacillus yanchengensis]|uniref:Uncharacterized protein n=1 Tax=Pontibacillus yanchengensis Y32 TaxID=1385514 RepID=A0A0A2T638_9BACI|nr:hypothetical protein [Pontibacillus yanchengensis]KGP70954.1 hypothetical protein N782_02665 [Pontibacillus yanchengensis Y32]